MIGFFFERSISTIRSSTPSRDRRVEDQYDRVGQVHGDLEACSATSDQAAVEHSHPCSPA